MLQTTAAARAVRLVRIMVVHSHSQPVRETGRQLPDVKHPRPPARRFTRSDGRFDLPVVTGRTPQEVARRLA